MRAFDWFPFIGLAVPFALWFGAVGLVLLGRWREDRRWRTAVRRRRSQEKAGLSARRG